MTDIEKKAREYAEKEGTVFDDDNIQSTADLDLQKAFLTGATYALVNQWRDAEKEKPEDGQVVLILTTYIGANGGEPRTFIEQFTYFEEYGFWLKEKRERCIKLKVLAWMEIPEYKPKGE
jgi:hypothetical protein